MSHFLTLVILKPHSNETIEDQINQLFAPYSKHLEVPEYLRDCYCKPANRATCSNCHGTGQYMSTQNPQGKWTWFVIGGRWDGFLFGVDEMKVRESDNGYNFGSQHHNAQQNNRNTNDIPWDNDQLIPYAFVTPDGKWYERGHMLMFGMRKNEMDQEAWNTFFREKIAEYPDHLVVTLDCHQ